ncbi:hypothetical protein BH10PSE19_BH10PSE19_09840 [soil metagenome]
MLKLTKLIPVLAALMIVNSVSAEPEPPQPIFHANIKLNVTQKFTAKLIATATIYEGIGNNMLVTADRAPPVFDFVLPQQHGPLDMSLSYPPQFYGQTETQQPPLFASLTMYGVKHYTAKCFYKGDTELSYGEGSLRVPPPGWSLTMPKCQPR